MPKAILMFNLPEEDEEFREALNGVKYLGALQEVDSRLRSMEKDEGITHVGVDEVRRYIREALDERDLKLW